MRRRGTRWQVLGGVSVCYLFYYTGRQNFGWALSGLREDLGLSSTQIGWVSGVALLCYGVGQVASGHLGDRFGARRLVAIGALASCACNWLTSWSRGFWSLIAAWSLNNLAQSLGFAPGSRLIANWWSGPARGLAFGIFTFAAGCSSILSFATSILVLERLSWVWIFRLPVLLMPLGALILVLLVVEHPARMGPPGGVAPMGDRPADREADGEGAGARRRPVLGHRRFQLACLGFGFNNWGRMGLLVWVPGHVLGPGWRESPGAAWLTLALPLGMALGALVAGWGAERFARGDHAGLSAGFLLLAAATSLALFVVPVAARRSAMALLFLGGFFVFGPFSSFSVLSAELLGPDLLATGIGLMNATGYAVAALGELVIGAAIDASGSSAAVFPITAGACLVAAACSLAIRRPRGTTRSIT